MITQEQLKEILHYDPETGVFTWKDGRVAGTKTSHGYTQIGIKRKLYYAHRLAFLYMSGVCPKIIDHINRDRADNSFNNLRDGSGSLNGLNRSTQHGVATYGPGKYRATIVVEGTQFSKRFSNYEEAVDWRQRALRSALREFD